ncbi:MAG: symmetrical bis(5'-nucleosyl)-tetraphosphatase [Magnetococcales bacterium]|nr:symmetrical bis(5'-nucleosyl)-tetraphosphatase [Magnetococcales bacterium]
MAVYAIGDVHGCLPELKALLKAVRFHPGRDRLWFVGDIFNRGPDSLGTIRFVRDLGERAVTLLGNHEVRALGGLSGRPDRGFARQMAFFNDAPDLPELYAWLRTLPLIHHDPELGASMVHAGFYPGWSREQAQARADDLQRIFRDDARIGSFFATFPTTFPESEPNQDDESARLHFALAVLTRLRICHPDGRVVWSIPGESGGTAFRLAADSPYRPWYRLLDWPEDDTTRIIYGHWAVAGLTQYGRFSGLDSGCVYGGRLTAMRLDHPDHPITQVACPGYVSPE